jgi:hypothetical protein
MLNSRVLVIPLVVLSMVFVLFSCSNSDEEKSGVARIDSTSISNDTVDEQQSANEVLTDEEIVTLFVSCLRDFGFDGIPDPEVNADGTINFQALRESIVSNSNFDPENENRGDAFRECLPKLQGAIFARNPSPEDEIELQDNLLYLAQCLRDNGIDASDPDFSGGSRAAFGSILNGVDREDDKIRENLSSCSEEVFAGGPGRLRGGGGR